MFSVLTWSKFFFKISFVVFKELTWQIRSSIVTCKDKVCSIRNWFGWFEYCCRAQIYFKRPCRGRMRVSSITWTNFKIWALTKTKVKPVIYKSSSSHNSARSTKESNINGNHVQSMSAFTYRNNMNKLPQQSSQKAQVSKEKSQSNSFRMQPNAASLARSGRKRAPLNAAA